MAKSHATRLIGKPVNGISEYRLGNGLKVLLLPDHSAPVVTTMVIYRVGSRNEGPGNTGSAHFFEHLMFKGSRRFNEAKGNNLDALLKQIGAQYNAYTSNDQTVYFEQASSEYLELCLAIEADRMRGLRMTKEDRDSEMTVVRNEMEQGENWPQQVMSKKLWATAFTQHPYHHDTIGSRTEVENVPMENMRDFYNTYYWPNNATLVVAGDFESKSALKMIEKQFGRHSKSPHKIPAVYTVEPPQEGENRFEIRRAGNLYRLSLGFHIPEARHADFAALELLCDVLGNSYSRSSKLYKRLVEGGVASKVYAFARELHDPGLLEIDVDLTPSASLGDAEAAVLDEIEKLKSAPIPDDELARIKTGRIKSFLLRLAETRYFAYQLAQAEAVADWRWLMESRARIEAVTTGDIMRVAGKYLTRDNRTVGAFIPKTEEELAAAAASATDEPESVAVKPKKLKVNAKKAAPDAALKTLARFMGKRPVRASVSERIVSRKLDNGLTINVLSEKPGSNTVAVGISIRAGNFFEPRSKQNLSDIVGSMLPMGSQGLSKSELADRLVEMGMTSGLHFWVRPYLSATSFQLLREDLSSALELVGTVVRYPAFNEGDLETIKGQWRGDYKEQEAHPGSVAANTLGGVLYDSAHVFHQKPVRQQMSDLESMTVADLFEFHSAHYTPGNSIITIVGDIDADAAIAAVEAVFGDWKGEAAPACVVPLAPPVEARRIDIQMPDKPGVEIIMGKVLALKKADADYMAAQIGQRILGGDTLTARLGKKLREEGGLTYGVYAGTWDDSFGGSPWFISMSVNGANIKPAIEMARAVMTEFVAGGVSQAEFDTEVESMIGAHNLSLCALSGLAHTISQKTALGLPLDDIDTYGEKLRSLTVADVNAAIGKYFDPSDLVTVVAGEF